jgi:hypothetical protein
MDAAKLLKAETHSISSFLVYVCPQMINDRLNPAISVTNRSSRLTFSWSPTIYYEMIYYLYIISGLLTKGYGLKIIP